jgi:kinesin family protein 11
VHEETVRIVDEQMNDIGTQMQALDDFVSRARSQNAQHHDSHATSLQGLSSTVRVSYDNIGSHFASTYGRVRSLGDEMTTSTAHLHDTLSPLEITLRQPLADLRSNVTSTMIQEYIPTGETPQKVQYHYPTQLPQTQNHDVLLSSLRNPHSSHVTVSSPSKQNVFNDATVTSGDLLGEMLSPSSTLDAKLTEKSMPLGGLREIDMNINAGLLSSSVAGESGMALVSNTELGTSIFKKSVTVTGILGAGKPKLNKKPSVVTLEGRENSIVPLFTQSTGRRRSPRTG